MFFFSSLKEIFIFALQYDGLAIQYIQNPDKDLQLEAVKNNGWAIQYIQDPDKDVQLEAVKKDGSIIQCIQNPDKDVQLEAIKNNPFVVHFAVINEDVKNEVKKREIQELGCEIVVAFFGIATMVAIAYFYP